VEHVEREREKNKKPGAICLLQPADQLALCGEMASPMSTTMTHQLSAIFNPLDASPSNAPILSGEAVAIRRRERGAREMNKEKMKRETEREEVMCNYDQRPPTSTGCTHTLGDNEMEGKCSFYLP